MIPLDGERFVTVGGRSVVLEASPATLPGSARWAFADVQSFLDGGAPEPAETYGQVEAPLDKYIDFRDAGTSDILALWTLGTYVYPLFEAYPYLALQGPRGSGKTKVLDTLAKLAFNARVSSSMSPASLFRVVQATRGMLGIDEAERLSDPRDPLAADLRLLLNTGYKQGAPAIRCEGDDHQVTEFAVYGPKVIASIRGLEDVLESRCIRIVMLRTVTPKGNLVVSESGENWGAARHALYCFALQHFAGVRDLYLRGAGADRLNNRSAELWRPLLTIAAYLDEHGAAGLLELARRYAQEQAGQAEEDGLDDWRASLLLAMYKLAIAGITETTPKQIALEMAGSGEDGDNGPSAQWAGYRLREFGFKQRRTGQQRLYQIGLAQVEDVMLRYGLEVPGPEAVTLDG